MEEIFFTIDSEQIDNNNFSLSKSESHHFINSLRGEIGDLIWLLDGKGSAYKSQVISIKNSLVSGHINHKIPNYGESASDVHLIMGLIKGHRMDFALEKATELGVKSIQPIIFERCVKKKLNFERTGRIIESAAKQAGRSFFPVLHPLIKLDKWIKTHFSDINILFHMNGSQNLKDIINTEKKSFNMIIGPEGDFSDNEIEQFENINAFKVNLSPCRLRSETSVIAGLANIKQLLSYTNG